MRLIDADALIDDIKNHLWDWGNVNGITAQTVLKQTITDIENQPTASPWHRVEEPPKDACDCLVCWTTIHDEETGEVTGHGFWCEKGWYEDGLLGEVGFYCQRREETHPARVEPDYWMPIEPPKEDA